MSPDQRREKPASVTVVNQPCERPVRYDVVDAPRRWRTHSRARWLNVELLGRITRIGDVCEVVLSTSLQPRGPLTPLRRVIANTMKNSWDQHLEAIRRTIESPARDSS
jgi:hypothetical protein